MSNVDPHDKLPRLPFKPYGALILVMRDSPYKKLGSIFVPDTAQAVKRSGIVLDTGRGVFRDDGPMRGTIREHEFKRGDWVFWPNFGEIGAMELTLFEVLVPTGEAGEYKEKREVLLIHESTIFGSEKDGKLVAARDAVVVQIKKPEETKTEGGIIIPETVQKATNDGVVFAQGPGPWGDDECTRLAMRTKVGEHVYWQDYAPTPHDSLAKYAPPGYDLCIIKRNEPLCVKEPDAPYDPV